MMLAVLAHSAAAAPDAWQGVPGTQADAQAIYRLPQDHAFHTGPTYHANEYLEWHYASSFLKDAAGQNISIFWSIFASGWIEEKGRPRLFSTVSLYNIDTDDYNTSEIVWDNFNSTGQGESDPAGFGFSYTFSTDDGAWQRLSYSRAQELWTFEHFDPSSARLRTKCSLKLTFTPRSPGYVSPVQFGVEQQGVDSPGDWNPESLYGLSYYLAAPQMEVINGTLDWLGASLTLTGVSWYEHQWGNYFAASNKNSRYAWGYIRRYNGDFFTLRQWCNASFVCEPAGNRYVYYRLQGDGGYKAEFALGSAMVYKPTKWYTPLGGNKKYPLYGKLTTPQGIFLLEPSRQEQFASAVGGLVEFWEGVTFAKRKGARAGQGHLEYVDFPAVPTGFPGRDLETSNLSRSSTGGMAPFAWKGP